MILSETSAMWKNRFLLFLSALPFVACNAQNIYDYHHSLKFANYLYETGDYKYAIDEYKRAWFMADMPKTMQLRLFQSYIFSGNSKDGLHLYLTKYPSRLSNNDSLELVYGKMLINSERFEDLYWLTDQSRSMGREQKLYLNLSLDLLSGNWSLADTRRKEMNDLPGLNPYISILNDIENTKYKSPALSICLSAIVPGMGKVYSGYWNEGLLSLLTVSLFTWQAYRGFNDKGTSSIYGWTYAALSATFYVGNLYGSFKSAKRKNHILREKILLDAKNTYSHMFRY